MDEYWIWKCNDTGDLTVYLEKKKYVDTGYV